MVCTFTLTLARGTWPRLRCRLGSPGPLAHHLLRLGPRVPTMLTPPADRSTCPRPSARDPSRHAPSAPRHAPSAPPHPRAHGVPTTPHRPPRPPPRGEVGVPFRRLVFLNATLGCPRHPDQRCRPVDVNWPPSTVFSVVRCYHLRSPAPPQALARTHTHTHLLSRPTVWPMPSATTTRPRSRRSRGPGLAPIPAVSDPGVRSLGAAARESLAHQNRIKTDLKPTVISCHRHVCPVPYGI